MTGPITIMKLLDEPSGLVNWLVEHSNGDQSLVSNRPFKDTLTPMQRVLIAAEEAGWEPEEKP